MSSSTKSVIDTKTVSHIAQLANLSIPASALAKATQQFGSVLGYVSNIQKLDTDVIQDFQTAVGATNVWREDIVDSSRTLTQEEALSSAPKKHDGYFLVDSILSE